MTDDTLTPREVAEELGITVRTVQRWIADGRLPAQRVGGRMRVSRRSLLSVASASVPSPGPDRPIRRLLVANRGEIVTRVARTARRMGMEVVGVHAPDDRAPDGVDEAVEIGSYLSIGEIIDAARAAQADAIHPGYGFLAENPDFARQVEDAGLTWVGPPPDAIAAMGDKAAARQRAADAGAPVVPGYDGAAQDDATFTDEAGRIGFPLIVKPAAGGGGKGMRVVRSPDELQEALAAARREAARAFGDDGLVLERYLGGARHVEIQVLFDRHGAGVHLGERDCSTQRRSQKVVEEAPAPGLTAEGRERMGAAAVAVAASVGYVGAGTVEMLLADDGSFAFLEMNTRLQVEHPVTEAVTGRDLVEDQLRIAAGEPLAALGLIAPPALRGHAIEARVYAEDPEAGYLPATGPMLAIRWPGGVRIDTGVRPGDVVGDRYDPMIAKVVASGRTRAAALDRLRDALDRTEVVGVRTNLRFLRWLLRQSPMRDGRMRTDTLGGMTLPAPVDPPAEAWSSAAAALAASSTDPWAGGWRLNAPPAVLVEHAGRTERVAVATGDPGTVAVDGDSAHVVVEGQSLEFRLARAPTVDEALRHAGATGGGAGSALVSPMPGRVVAVRARAGEAVAALQPVVVIEAMKMEHAVVAPAAGRLHRVHVDVGSQVQRGDLLAEVAPDGEPDGEPAPAYDGGDG